MGYNDSDGDIFETTSKCSTMAYNEAGTTNPREEISMIEVHDCFSISTFLRATNPIQVTAVTYICQRIPEIFLMDRF